jgi:hypothetical protein
MRRRVCYVSVARGPLRVKLGGKGTFSTRPIMPNDRTLPRRRHPEKAVPTISCSGAAHGRRLPGSPGNLIPLVERGSQGAAWSATTP